MPLTLPSGHDILVFRSYDLTGAFPRTAVRPDDPIQDRGHDRACRWEAVDSSAALGLILGALFLQPSFLVRDEDQLGSRQKAISFFERDNSSNYPIPAYIEIPTDGTEEWEIDVKQLQIEKKVASWHRGTYCSQEVAIKFLKPERVNAEMLREFSQEIVKVADFGVVRVQIESGVMTAETGTYRWMAPEVIEHKPYSHKADVFSYGIVIWELLTGHGLRPKIPKKTHPKVKGLLQRCWNQDPKDRPEFEEIIEMLQHIMIEVGDEHPADKDKHCWR
ncbi:hypothetical protein F2Q69_00038040 [Brassica cretica]|uniref:Protein kinase domain-containing protein n=1 Tax=Brassica cretica TaxID=69181 RepID=A0A8S9SKW8_BRACR|nr:hypothetical protein F2Q69_00038040 [Brassica cretica]